MGLSAEFRGHIKSMCLRSFQGLLSKTPDEVWDFFEYLVRETWEFEQAKEALVPPVLCNCCQSSSHEMCSCPLSTSVDALEHCITDMMG